MLAYNNRPTTSGIHFMMQAMRGRKVGFEMIYQLHCLQYRIHSRILVRSSTGSSTRLLIGGSGFESRRTNKWMNSSTEERWLVKPGLKVPCLRQAGSLSSSAL